ncbi:KIFC1-like kinesin [Zopfochytrium polystomum]|nr:KIFC1-like kinesin [Zopfochytrium polystomum]
MGSDRPAEVAPPQTLKQRQIKPPTKLAAPSTSSVQHVEDPPLLREEPKNPPQSLEEEFKVHSTGMKRKAADDDVPRTRQKLVNETSLSSRNARAVPPASTKTSTTAPRLRSAPGAAVKKPLPATAATVPPIATKENLKEQTHDAGKKKKRPAWDLKGRLQDLEQLNDDTQSKLAGSTQRISQLTENLDGSRETIEELVRFKQSLQTAVALKERENVDMSEQIRQYEDQLKHREAQHEQAVKSLTLAMKEAAEAAESKERAYIKEVNLLNTDLQLAKDEIRHLKSVISSQSATHLAVESELRMSRLKIETLEATVTSKAERIKELETVFENATKRTLELDEKLREEESTRRKLHNTIQELKGNIRVFCRVRPLLEAERSDSEKQTPPLVFNPSDEKTITVNVVAENGTTIVKSIPFGFDKVFTPDAPQERVFSEISQLVQSALDGYNVCIFAYGQTGSGKTYTMEGVPSEPEKMGMIPRAFTQIFESAEQLKSKGWTYNFEAQFLEIYNETIRDLLAAGGAEKKHEVKHVGNRTSVTDVVTATVSSPREVQVLLSKAAQRRAVAATNCNERSSRSHSVFTLRMSGQNSLTDEACEGVLNLIDLAGSERLSSSGSTGDRLKETQAINKSLSSLGDVIAALANKEAHIPYRNSKLTFLLQNSLGGSSKTLMFVNISPVPASVQETLCSLRFATKVNSCQIGTAQARKSCK